MKRRFFIQALAVTPGLLIFTGKEEDMNGADETIRLKMIYNNTGKSPGLESAWGLSVWIDMGNDAILLDTGGDAAVLRRNLHHAHLDPVNLSMVIISHNHWDHKNGLGWVLEASSSVPEVVVPEEVRSVYAEDFPQARVRGVTEPQEIYPGIWTTGSIKTIYRGDPLYEQSLVIVRGNRAYLLTGCSHPGIDVIVQRVNKIFPGKKIALVTGGFHLGNLPAEELNRISDTLMHEGVEKIAPSHCTGEEAIRFFRKEWEANFTDFNLGDELVIE